MLSFDDFENFIAKHHISPNTKLSVAYRQTAYSDIQFLDLVLEGNRLLATDTKDALHKIQIDLQTVGDLLEAIQIQKRYEKENLSTLYDSFEGDISMVLHRNGSTLSSSSGFKVKRFICDQNQVVFDIIVY